jgi:hypothetical protein
MKLSNTMQRVFSRIRQAGGTAERMPGGFWYAGGHLLPCGTKTIEALVARGVLVYDRWKENKHGRSFPVRAAIKEGDA